MERKIKMEIINEQLEFDYQSHKDAELCWLPVDDCDAHPLNPRLALNENVVERIAEQLKLHGYKPEYAMSVRSLNGRYQVVGGRHRLEACRRADLDRLLAWVHHGMTDEQAHSFLLLDNDQTELSPLEKGKHAFDHIDGFNHKGGRGQKGGVSDYARKHGLSQPLVQQWYQGYKVAKTYKNLIGLSDLSISLLYEISKSPELAWQSLCQHALDESWTVDKGKEMVVRITKIEDAIPDWWDVDFVSVVDLAIEKKAKATSLKSAFDAAAKYAKSLKTVTIYEHEDEGEKTEIDGRKYHVLNPVPVEYDQSAEFQKDIIALTVLPSKGEVDEIRKSVLEYAKSHSEASIKHRPVMSDAEWKVHMENEEELRKARERRLYTPKLICGDVLTGLKTIGNDSIDLVCTDPPYNMGDNDWDVFTDDKEYIEWSGEWLTECYRVLKDTGSIYVFGLFPMLWQFMAKINDIGFFYGNFITWDTIQGSGGGLWVNRQENILYFSKTDEPFEDPESVKLERHEENVREYKGKEYHFKNPSNVWRFPCVDAKHSERTDHPTQKPVEIMERIIKASCPVDGTVLDPFIGSGTTGVAAMKNRRLSIGIDVDPAYIDIAKSRIEVTVIGGQDEISV
jgi:site-specific DNA-methyltransferase (adenine-specific)